MLGKMRQMFVSSFNEDGDDCQVCHARFVSGASEIKKRDGAPDMHVRILTCANGHENDRTTDGG